MKKEDIEIGKNRIIVWGAGKMAGKCIESIVRSGYVVCKCIDNNPKLSGKQICNIDICLPHEFLFKDDDCVIISSDKYFNEISDELINTYNIDINKIFHNDIFSVKNFLDYYRINSQELKDDMLSLYEFVSDRKRIRDFNYSFWDEDLSKDIQVFYDEDHKCFYGMYKGKRLYLPKTFETENMVKQYIGGLLKEQHQDSPHRYLTESFGVRENDIVLDGGAAEGNFAIEIIDDVKHIILVEENPEWVEALKLTFLPYIDKVTIINKRLSDINDENSITIDEIYKNFKISFVKLDVEGAEPIALQNARKCMGDSEKLRIIACAYHNVEDESVISDVLDKEGFQTWTSNGYMTFMHNNEEPKKFVHGLVKAERKSNVEK